MVTDPRSPIRAALWALIGDADDLTRIKMARTWLNMHWADRPSHPDDFRVFTEVRDLMDSRIAGENDVTAHDLHQMLCQIVAPALIGKDQDEL